MKQANRATLPKHHAFLATVLAFTACGAAAQTAGPNGSREVQPERRIVVSLADHKLAVIEGQRVVKVYNVAVGAAVSPSPRGEFRIVQRLVNPTYYKPGVVIGPGKDNPLGPRWIGLDVKGLGIHGTNRPDSIGRNASHGCIRLRNRDIEDLFARVQVGDRVSLIAERSEEVTRWFGGQPETTVANDEPSAEKSEDVRGER